MSSKRSAFRPESLDLQAFARDGATLDGSAPASAFGRLAASVVAGTAPQARVDWAARGESRPRRGGEPEVWLHLQARCELELECQRCLEPVRVPLSAQRSFLFVADEAAAAALDAQSDHDVLVLERPFDLPALVEDELLLELPLLPRHEACPTLPAAAGPVAAADGAEPAAAPAHPFAALAALKRGDTGSR